MILAGDIGGTNARFALFELVNGRLSPGRENVYPSRKYKSLEEIVKGFLGSDTPSVEHACFGIAGPIVKGRVETVNLAWIVEARALAAAVGLADVVLINDLMANAYGIGALRPDDFAVLQAGAPDAQGNGAVIAAGTGLGEAGLYWTGKTHLPIASEGGHTDFAPGNELQAELLAYLRKQFGHVSWERVVSGPGLHNVYNFLKDSGRGEEPEWLREEIERTDPSAAISRAGLEGKSELCVDALELFIELYGAEAGNLALKMLATGGVYVGGGIAPRLIKKLQEPGFVEAFANKGRVKPLMQSMPVKVILNEKTALLGAARCAAIAASLE